MYFWQTDLIAKSNNFVRARPKRRRRTFKVPLVNARLERVQNKAVPLYSSIERLLQVRTRYDSQTLVKSLLNCGLETRRKIGMSGLRCRDELKTIEEK